MLDIYVENLHTCDHIGCCETAPFQVETESRNGAFITVCREHADDYGSDSWTRDYNSRKLVTVRPVPTILWNAVKPPVFNPDIQVTVF